MPTTPRGCSCFLLVWLLVWTTGVLIFDAFLGWTLYQQGRTLTFASTEGTVTKSAIRTGRDGDGDSHQLKIAYDYDVNGQRYTGTRYTSSQMGTDSNAWHKIAVSLPAGTRVPVWYNPDAPAESMLRPGLVGMHLSMIWFLTPFNVIMLGGWVAFVRSRRSAFDPADPRCVEMLPTGVRVRLPTIGRAGRFAGCLLGLTFVGTFALGFGFAFNPPPLLGGGAYLVAVALAAFVALRYTPPVLEVNESERALRLALGGETREVPFAAVRAVQVTHEEVTDSEASDSYRYHCDLLRVGAPEGEPPVRITTFSDPETAERFVTWLRAQVGATEG